MIVKGGAIGGGGLADHLRSADNERIDLVSVDGLLATDIAGATAEMRARAAGLTRKGLFHFQVSPGLAETWGPEQEARAIKAVVEEYCLEGQPLAVVRHAKDAQRVGRDAHIHIVALRVRPTGRVISDSFSRVRNEKIARELEHALGHTCVPGRHNCAVLARLRAEGRTAVAEWMSAAAEVPRPEAAYTFQEHQQERRTGVRKADVAAQVLAAWRAADTGPAFAAALAERGYRLAQGREPGAVLVIDQTGGTHELTRLLRAAQKAAGQARPAREVRAEIMAKLGDAALPPLAEASAEVQTAPKKEKITDVRHTRPRRLSDTFGEPRTLRQSHADGASARAAPRRADRLRDVPRSPVAREQRRASLLLPRHAADQLEQRGARDANRVRWAGLRDRGVAPVPAPRPITATTRGEHHMAAVAGAADRATDDVREKMFAEALHEFRDLATRRDRTPDQSEEMAALADALRSMARTEDALRRKAGKDAEAILELARRRDQAQEGQAQARPIGDIPRRSRADDLTTWKALQRERPDTIREVAQNGYRIDIRLADGQTIRDHGARLTTEAPMSRDAAEAMALGAKAKGWAEVTLTGSAVEKRTMAEAMVAHGLRVTNPELQDYMARLDKAHELATDREALAAARQQHDLTNTDKFATALSAYQHGLVSGAAERELLRLKADLMARGEAIHHASGGMADVAATWAAEAAQVDTAQATRAWVAKA